jgi:hypothetical protein
MELLLTLLLLLGLETEEEAPEGEGEVWADAGGLRDDGGVAGVAGGAPRDGDMAGDSSEWKGWAAAVPPATCRPALGGAQGSKSGNTGSRVTKQS